MPPPIALLARIGIYIFFGVTTSLTWLFQFLRMDKLPEPARMIVKIFFLGVLITVPVFVVEFVLFKAVPAINLPSFWNSIFYWFIVIALIEETFKYLVVRAGALKSKHFDEPVDAMIYMIIAALGFAAAENVMYLFSPNIEIFSFYDLLAKAATISLFRFLGATFLHALCSGLVGFFLAQAVYKKGRSGLVLIGLLIAILLHGLYNFSIIELAYPLNLAIPIIILLGLSVFITLAFIVLRKKASSCKI